jgi:hypothetical protein
MEDTPESFYDEMPPYELELHLEALEGEISELHGRRAELDLEEMVLQEHKGTIIRLLGVVVLDDYRNQL